MKTISLKGTVTADGIRIDDESQPAFCGAVVPNHPCLPLGAKALVDFHLERHWLQPHESFVGHITVRQQS